MEEKKKYSQAEEHEANINEPAFKYYKITDEVLNPCTFTLQELEKEISEAHEDIKEGRIYTSEELRKIHPL